MKNQPPFLQGYRSLKIPIADDGGAPAWPELFPLSKIDELRDAVGARHFAAQMMLNPDMIEKARLDASAIRFYDWELDMGMARLGDIQITGWALYWDPSSARKHGDASVCVFLLRDDKNRRAFVHECLYLGAGENDQHPLATQCARVLDFMGHLGVARIAVEVNGIGNALPEILRREAAALGQPVSVQRIVNSENKAKRILDAVEPLLGTGRLYAHEKIKDTGLMDEMGDWTPDGWNRDDGLDAVAGALRMQPIPLHPRNRAPRAIQAKTDFPV
jgi:hypothetical protein